MRIYNICAFALFPTVYYISYVIQVEGIEGLINNTNEETNYENKQLFTNKEDSKK